MMMPELEIEGALLRPWRLADAAALVAAWHDDDVAAWNPVPASPTLATATTWISGVADRDDARRSLDWVIDCSIDVDAAETNVVGEVGLSGFSDEYQGALIGYWLLPEGRGQGFATTAVSAVTRWAHEALSLDMIVARCHTSNMASQHVAARAGYRNERSDATGHQLWISRTRES